MASRDAFQALREFHDECGKAFWKATKDSVHYDETECWDDVYDELRDQESLTNEVSDALNPELRDLYRITLALDKLYVDYPHLADSLDARAVTKEIRERLEANAAELDVSAEATLALIKELDPKIRDLRVRVKTVVFAARMLYHAVNGVAHTLDAHVWEQLDGSRRQKEEREETKRRKTTE